MVLIIREYNSIFCVSSTGEQRFMLVPGGFMRYLQKAMCVYLHTKAEYVLYTDIHTHTYIFAK